MKCIIYRSNALPVVARAAVEATSSRRQKADCFSAMIAACCQLRMCGWMGSSKCVRLRNGKQQGTTSLRPRARSWRCKDHMPASYFEAAQ